MKQNPQRQNSIKKPRVVIEEDSRTPERAVNLRRPSECISPKALPKNQKGRLLFGKDSGPQLQMTDWEVITPFQAAAIDPVDRNPVFRGDSESPTIGRFSN